MPNQPQTPESISEAAPHCLVCRASGVTYQNHWLGPHLIEAHSMTVQDYWEVYPDAPTASDDAVAEFKKRRKASRTSREHPPPLTDVKVEFSGVPFKLWVDVPPEDCLPMPAHYRLPTSGDLAMDVQDAALAFAAGLSMYVWGLPGTGKDAFFHALSASLRRPALIFQIEPDADIRAWFFKESLKADGKGGVNTEWEEGELLKALRDGYTTRTGRKVPYMILFTDFDRATREQAESMRLVMDSISGRVKGPGGVTYDVFEGTQIVVTANTSGGGDQRGRCISANVIDASILDRFGAAVRFHAMEWADEGEICKEKFPWIAAEHPQVFSTIGQCVEALRNEIQLDRLYAECSHRLVVGWLTMIQTRLQILGMSEQVIRQTARFWIDKLPDEDTRAAAIKLIDPHTKGGTIGAGSASTRRGRT